jgi:hypothetical protein
MVVVVVVVVLHKPCHLSFSIPHVGVQMQIVTRTTTPSDDDDSDDVEAALALQAELAKIKAEREAVKRIKQAEADAVEESKFALPVSAREKQNPTLFLLL